MNRPTSPSTKNGKGYVCRLRIPFDSENSPRNYLTKLLKYPKYYDNINSLSQKSEFVSSCIELIDRHAPYGIYNITNPGYVSTKAVVDMFTYLRPDITKDWRAYEDDEEFYTDATALRSNCILDSSKLLNEAGVKMRHVQDALEEAITQYKL